MVWAALLAVSAALALPAVAQGQATKLIVTFQAGGPGDQIGRVLAKYMTESTGRQMVVENKPGAGGRVGMLATVQAPPDGETLVVGPSGAYAIAPHTQKLEYDPRKDLAPVSMVGFSIFVIAVNKLVPVTTLGELLAWAKRDPSGVFYGSSGVGSNNHLAGQLLKLRSGANFVNVPYKGGSAGSVNGLLTGEVPMVIAGVNGLKPLHGAGKIKILAVINSRRSVSSPEFPTVAELGFPGFAADAWAVIFAPPKTPANIIERLGQEFAKVLAMPELQRDMIRAAGTEVVQMSYKETLKFLEDDYNRWGDVVRKGKIVVGPGS